MIMQSSSAVSKIWQLLIPNSKLHFSYLEVRNWHHSYHQNSICQYSHGEVNYPLAILSCVEVETVAHAN